MIHSSSVISPRAEIGKNVSIGPFCHIRGKVTIGNNTKLDANVTIGFESGSVEIGEGNRFSPGCVIGCPPQDRYYKNDDTCLTIGNNNQFRECVTVSLGTQRGGGKTQIGSHNLFMAYVHFGHDCCIGNHNFIANSCQFAGNVVLDNYITIGGMCAFNQSIRLGSYSFVGGLSCVNKDILPFSIAQGNHALIKATNKIGLERNGMSSEEISNIHKAIRILMKGSSTISEGLKRIKDECISNDHIKYLIQFVESTGRGLAK